MLFLAQAAHKLRCRRAYWVWNINTAYQTLRLFPLSVPKIPRYILDNYIVLHTLPLSRRSWHLLRQSGLLVNSTKAFSAWSRVAVSVVSYSCLHRFSSWARLWNTGKQIHQKQEVLQFRYAAVLTQVTCTHTSLYFLHKGRKMLSSLFCHQLIALRLLKYLYRNFTATSQT